MEHNGGSFKDKFYHDYAPIITGLGAAVVILGALFKIQHYPGASIMLIVGLGTEALLFIMFAFAPKEPPTPTLDHWARVYPQMLDEEEYEYEDEEVESGEVATTAGTVARLDDMMTNAGLDQDVINRLGEGFKSLANNVNSMKDISDTSVASSEFTNSIKHATISLQDMGKSYAATAEAMAGMANAAVDAKEYHNQVQNITKNLGSLNAVYEMELQDANNHLKAMNKFYSNLSSAMENMADASKDTDNFKNQLSNLTQNITQLNNVYGSMLTAMRG